MRLLLGLTGFVLAIASALPAQAAVPLDLHGAVRYALAHDPAVLQRRATVAQNEATYAKDHAAEFPSLAGSLQNQLFKANPAYPGAFAQYGVTTSPVFSENIAQIGATWNVYNGSLLQIQAQEAKRQVEASRDDLQRSEQQLAADVAAAWYNVVQQRVAVRLTEGDRAYQAELLAAAQAQERVGRVAGVDVLRAQVNALRSQAAYTSAVAGAENARESFAQRIGAPATMQFAFPVALVEPPLPRTLVDALIARALAARTDIAAERAQVALARLADRAIESDRLPQLQLTGSFGNAEIPTTQTTSAQFIPGIGLVPGISVVRNGFWQVGATETFTVPLIEYGARRAAHRAAHAQLDAAEAALSSGESAVALEVRQDYRAVETARANLATSNEADQLGAESGRIAQLQYRNGLISLTDATAAEQSALSAANDLVTARVAYLNALVRLRAAVGVADPVSVVDVGEPL